MRTRTRWVAAGSCAAVITLLWPGPAHADTTLGGYTATAYASVVHVQVYEPVLPLPSNPQGDISLAYTKSSIDTGPATRATASYVWPGDVIGDGFDQLTGKPGSTYPVQVNSRYPATETAPATNAIQLTDGNGMATSTDGTNTKGSVTLVGLAGPDTSLTTGLLTGLQKIGGHTPSNAPTAAAKPVPLPTTAGLAALMTAQNVTSTSTVTLGNKTVTSTAHAAASNIKLLGGLISIDGMNVDSQVVSDGTKSTVSGGAQIGGVSIAGIKLGLSDKGIDLGSGSVQLPDISSLVTGLLKPLGIEVTLLPVKRTTTGPTGELSTQVLQISIDTKPLKSAINGPLATLIKLFPASSQSQLQILLDLGPRLVFTIGDVDSNATSSPAVDLGGGFTGGGGAVGGENTGTGGTGTGTTGGGDLGGTGADAGNPGTTTPGTGQGSQPNTQPVALNLPPLGTVPRMLILGALLVAAAVGWLMRVAGGVLLGTGGRCAHGLATGVPNLRKG